MPKELNLDEATRVIGEINTMDANLQSLIDMHDTTVKTINENQNEISRLEKLKAKNEELKTKANDIQHRVDVVKKEIAAKHKLVTDSGWFVPLPERKIAPSAAIRM